MLANPTPWEVGTGYDQQDPGVYISDANGAAILTGEDPDCMLTVEFAERIVRRDQQRGVPMTNFSVTVLDANVTIEVDDPQTGALIAVDGKVLAMYEGKGYTQMIQVVMRGGPFPGRVVKRELNDGVVFLDFIAGGRCDTTP